MEKKKKKLAKAITSKRDLQRLIAYLQASSKYGDRNSMIWEISVGTGFRMGDLVGLTVGQVRDFLRRGEFCIFESKKKNTKKIRQSNKKPRRVEIPIKLERRLKKYIEDKSDWEYMFPSNKKTYSHITVDRISKVLKNAGEQIGIFGVTAHSGRKTYATILYIESEYDLLHVNEMLGHSTFEQTRVYLDIKKYKNRNYLNCLNDYFKFFIQIPKK